MSRFNNHQSSAVQQWEVDLRPHDAPLVPAAVTVGAVDAPDGQLTALRWLLRDLTERKREEVERRALEKLSQQRERLADIGAITAELAHDLGNPLAGISMQAQLIRHRMERDRTQPVISILPQVQRILEESDRLNSLLKEFMEFAHEQRLDRRPLALSRLFRQIVDLWQPLAAARGIALSVDLPPGLPPLTGDEEKLRRVFDNLVKNSIEAITVPPGRIDIAVTDAAETIAISVSDTGVGIPPGQEPFRLFETTKPDGSGIGLAVARQIVLAHGGHIGYTALTPHGTVFRVELPRAIASLAARDPPVD